MMRVRSKAEWVRAQRHAEFTGHFRSEADCHLALLRALKLARDHRCSRCGENTKFYEKQGWHECKRCKCQVSLKSRTIFSGSKLPLLKLFLATYLVIICDVGMKSSEIQKVLGVQYETARQLKLRLLKTYREIVRREREAQREMERAIKAVGSLREKQEMMGKHARSIFERFLGNVSVEKNLHAVRARFFEGAFQQASDLDKLMCVISGAVWRPTQAGGELIFRIGLVETVMSDEKDDQRAVRSVVRR